MKMQIVVGAVCALLAFAGGDRIVIRRVVRDLL